MEFEKSAPRCLQVGADFHTREVRDAEIFITLRYGSATLSRGAAADRLTGICLSRWTAATTSAAAAALLA